MAELDLSKRRGELMDREITNALLTSLSNLMRGFGERLQHRFGEDAFDEITAICDAMDREIDHFFTNVAKKDGAS